MSGLANDIQGSATFLIMLPEVCLVSRFWFYIKHFYTIYSHLPLKWRHKKNRVYHRLCEDVQDRYV